MTKDRKPTRSDLLDELSSIQSLLGDAARDVAQPLADDDIPVLPPDIGEDAQIPLLGSGAAPATGADPLRKALSERANPFLPNSTTRPPAHDARSNSKAIEAMIAQRATNRAAAPGAPGNATAGRPPAALTEAQIQALVDEALAEWMPKIERDLRNRLIDLLKSRS